MELERLGRYEIRRRLGTGGMAVVYLAHDPFLDGPVAIKILREDDPDLRARFTREARAIARLRGHPNIVTVYDVGEDDGRSFMAMEYLGDETLAKVLRQTPPLPLPRRVELIAGLCDGLSRAHAEGIVHRDIKPDNLMVNGGVLKILDFGIARLANSGMTQDGMMMGSMPYMSPEQISGGTIDARSDIFAVGAVLYEAIALTRAFSGGIEVLHKILEVGHPPLRGIVPEVHPQLERIVDKALSREPQQRYQTAADMQQALLQVVGVLDGGDRTVIIKRPPPADGRLSTERRVELRRQQVTEQLELGNQALSAGDFDNALRHGERAATVDPESGPALDLIDAARSAIEGARISALLDEGEQLLAQSSLDEASAAARDALQASAQHADSALGARGEQLAAAIARAQERLAAIDRTWQRAQAAFAEGDDEEASQAALMVLDLDPARQDARDLSVRAHERLEQKRAHERAKQAALEQIRNARGLADTQEFEKAIGLLTRVVPPSDTLRLSVSDALAEVRSRQQQAADAEVVEQARQALQSGAFDSGLALLGKLHQPTEPHAVQLRKELEQARAKARELRARLDAAWRDAQAAFKSGNHAGAQRAAQTVLDLDPGRTDARELLARADRALKEAAALADARAREQQARDAAERQAREQAEQAKRLAALEEEKRQKELRARIDTAWREAQAALESGNHADARRAAQTVLDLEPGRTDAREMLDRAGRALKEAAALADAERQVQARLDEAQTLISKGRTDQASKLLDTVIAPSEVIRRKVAEIQREAVAKRQRDEDQATLTDARRAFDRGALNQARGLLGKLHAADSADAQQLLQAIDAAVARLARVQQEREAAERQAREAKERHAREAVERQAREAKEQQAREAAERLAREAKEQQAREAKERQAREAREQQAREAKERQAREAKEQQAREAAERLAREAEERQAREARVARERAAAAERRQGEELEHARVAAPAAVVSAPAAKAPSSVNPMYIGVVVAIVAVVGVASWFLTRPGPAPDSPTGTIASGPSPGAPAQPDPGQNAGPAPVAPGAGGNPSTQPDPGARSGGQPVGNQANQVARGRGQPAGNEGTRGQGAPDQGARDQAARDQAARDQAVRDQAARDQAARDQAARDQAARDQAARDQAARDQAARDQAAREQAAREQAERVARERTAQEAQDRGAVNALLAQYVAAYESLNEGRIKAIDPSFNSIPSRALLRSVDVETSIQSLQFSPDMQSANLTFTQTFRYQWARGGGTPQSSGTLNWKLQKTSNGWQVAR